MRKFVGGWCCEGCGKAAQTEHAINLAAQHRKGTCIGRAFVRVGRGVSAPRRYFEVVSLGSLLENTAQRAECEEDTEGSEEVGRMKSETCSLRA